MPAHAYHAVKYPQDHQQFLPSHFHKPRYIAENKARAVEGAMPTTPEVPRKAVPEGVAPTQIFAIVQIFNTLRLALILGCVCFVAWMGRDVLVAMAGTNTNINLVAEFFADIKFAVSIALAGFASLWAMIERRMRQKTVERLHGRVKHLETQIDPSRSSSNLTPSGKTNPNDLR